jgi:acyl-CoA synthetase (NDP forming)
VTRAPRTDRRQAGDLVSVTVEPGGIVVVGASSDPAKLSGRPLDYLRRFGFRGDVWVVNPRHESVAGYPCVPSVHQVPAGRADAAIVSLPADQVTAALRELDERGVHVAVVIGSGFESGDSTARRDLLAFLADPARSLRVIGPNCVGTMSPGSGAQLNFSSVLQTSEPKTGGAALVTQSGATGNGILMSLVRRGAGLSHWFSTGDELDSGALEIIAGLLPRPEVSCVGLFIEGITDIEWLPRVRWAMTECDKPVFVVKVADSDLGQLAAGGHTGRVVGSTDISRAVLAQAGFRRLETVAELTDCLVGTEIIGRLPARCQVFGVSLSGAGGVILADRVRCSPGLSMPPPGPDLVARLSTLASDRIPITNPLDVPFLGETEVYAGLLATVSAEAGADIVLAVESSLAHDRDVLTDMLCHRPREAAPVILSHLSEDDPIAPGQVGRLAGARVAIVPTPERAALLAGQLVAGPRSGAAARPLTQRAPAPSGANQLLGLEAIADLVPAEFPWARWTKVGSMADAVEAAARFGLPVVVKAAGRTIAHRTELGAIEVVPDVAGLDAAYHRVAAICARYGDEIVVQEGVPPGQEILLAVIRDPEYGLAAVLRPGGTLTELLDEQVVLWHGWTPADRLAALTESRLGTLAGGYRGTRPGDLSALHQLTETALVAFGAAGLDFVEFNPVVMAPDRVRVLDALGTRPVKGAL